MSGSPPSDLHCRLESPNDGSAIREVNVSAFGRSEEALLVDRLRTAGALSLSAVAEVNGEVVGHIAFSPVTIESPGERLLALALAPMAVRPAWQRRGIGSALVRWSLSECHRLGHQVIIVLGHADYYPRFGFVPATPRGIHCPFPVPDEAFMVLELKAGVLESVRGTIRYRPEFANL